MSHETRILAEFASGLRYEDIPADVVAIAKDCMIDTIGTALFGSGLPWSRSIGDYVRHTGGTGKSVVLGPGFPRVGAPAAALANGAFTHAFEYDSLRQPSIGVHPGATVFVAALAMAQELNSTGRDLIAAFVAGCEGMYRIALAAKSSSEKLGFHAPGITGVFGSALACANLMRLETERTVHALGIGGSLGSGLLAFAKAGNGGMVKRLHMGRAAEGGILAAGLARRGFEGPDVILEGKFGYLDVYARDGDPRLLVDDLGARWKTLTTAFKAFPCHVTAQAPVQALLALKGQHAFGPDDIQTFTLFASEKVLSHHIDPAPKDVATAQYSVPYSLALALYRDPSDPGAFLDGPGQDERIIALSRRIAVQQNEGANARNDLACRIDILLHDGRTLSASRSDFEGTATSPMSRERLQGKFDLLSGLTPARSLELYERLNRIEDNPVESIF